MPLFTCPLGIKRASLCGSGGRAVYRYGRPGKVELSISRLTLARRSLAGGGETQVQAANGPYGYILYDRTTRTGFDTSGRNDPQSSSGLIVRRGQAILSTRRCDDDAPIAARVDAFIPGRGTIVAH